MSDRPKGSLPWWAVLVLPAGAYLLFSVLVSLTASLRSMRLEIPYADARSHVIDDAWNLGLVQAAAFSAAIVAALYSFFRQVPRRDALGLAPAPLSRILVACGAGVSLQFVLTEISNVVQEFAPQSFEDVVRRHALLETSEPLQTFGAIFAFVLVAPFAEELLFRGILVRGLSDRYGRWFAIGLTAVAFGAIHMTPSAAIPAFVAGIVFAALADRYDSVWPSLAMHAAVNATPLLLPSELVAIRGFNVLDEVVTHLPPPLLIGSAIATLGALFFLFRPEPAE